MQARYNSYLGDFIPSHPPKGYAHYFLYEYIEHYGDPFAREAFRSINEAIDFHGFSSYPIDIKELT